MKKLLYLGIVLMLGSCGSDESVTDPSNKSESAEDTTPDIKVCYADAYAFAEKHITGAGQRLISANVTKNDGSYLYYFMSAPLDMSNYCIMVISEHKLEIISTNCGDPYDKQEQWKWINWYDDPCNPVVIDVDASSISTIEIGGLEIMTEDLGKDEVYWDLAMKACEDLGDGWRLPTDEELNILYKNKEQIGDFSDFYWSSFDSYLGRHGQNFNSGYIGSGYDDYWKGSVRAVRGNYNPALIEKVVKDFEHDSLSSNVSVNEKLDNNSQCLYPFTQTRLVSKSDVNGLSKSELRVMRNEIYARHGYVFKSEDLNTHFNKQQWYTPINDNKEASSQLNEIEKNNIDIIKAYE